jgi:hypothetical protein
VDTLLTGVLALAQLVLAAMGGYVSIRTPAKEHHTWWIIAFAFVGTCGVVLTIVLASRAGDAQNRLQGDITSLRVEGGRMSGQLTAVQQVMNTFAQTGIPGLKDFAKAITDAIQRQNEYTKREKTSSDQLCKSTTDLAQRIRKFEDDYEAASAKSENDFFAAAGGTGTRRTNDEMRELFLKQNAEREKGYREHLTHFQNDYLPDAKYFHDQIMSRLSLDERNELTKQNGQAEGSLTLARAVGADDEHIVAAYLDALAHTLCPAKH